MLRSLFFLGTICLFAAAQTQTPADVTALLHDAEDLSNKGEYASALDTARRALALSEKELGPNHPSIARILQSIGALLNSANRPSESRAWFERALSVRLAARLPEDDTFAALLTDYAYSLMGVGDYAAARIKQEHAIALLDEHQTGGRELGRALGNLAQIFNELGDRPSARAAEDRSLALLEKEAGTGGVSLADQLVIMGNTAREAGDYARSAALEGRAARIYEARMGPRSSRLAGALDNLGQSQLGAGQLEAAAKTFARALEIQKQALGPRSPWVGNIIQGLAKVAAASGNLQKSGKLYEQNLDIWREQLGNTHPFTLASMTQYTDVLAQLGLRGEAMTLALETARIRRDNIAATVRTVDERQALRYASFRPATLDTAITLALSDTPERRRAVWDAVIRSRALVLDEMSARYRAAHVSGPVSGALVEELSAARGELARLVMQGKGTLSSLQYDQQLELARDRTRRLDQSLAVQSAPYRSILSRERAAFAEVRASLPAGSALVAFVRFNRRNFTRSGAPGSPAYAAFVLRSGQEFPALLLLGSGTRIESLVRAWRSEIERERTAMGRSAARNELAYRTVAASLRAAVWDPLRPHLADSRFVFVVPDGALQAVNLAALPSGTGYLAERGPLLHTLSAERDLVGSAPETGGTSLLAVGAPAFSARDRSSGGEVRLRGSGSGSGCGAFRATTFEPLPGSAHEIRSLGQLWRAQGWQADVLAGVNATEGSFKQKAPGHRVIHLATHGFFLEDCPSSKTALENPLLRAGLALAGANRGAAASHDEEDGILSAGEIAALDLRGTEWVVLSGCDTGIGEIRVGEGVLGLRRAFQEAGVRTVVNSLWPVEDEEARRWMIMLYRARFIQRQSTPEAFRSANRRMLAELRAAGRSTHPFHWGCFVAVGDWR